MLTQPKGTGLSNLIEADDPQLILVRIPYHAIESTLPLLLVLQFVKIEFYVLKNLNVEIFPIKTKHLNIGT